MPTMRPDQERVRNLLTDTVTLLCKNGLQFSKELKVQGLLGITTDDNDVFVVHINERFGEAASADTPSTDAAEPDNRSQIDLTDGRSTNGSRVHSGRKTKRFTLDDDGPNRKIRSPGEAGQTASEQHRLLPPAEIKTESQGSRLHSSCSRQSDNSGHDDTKTDTIEATDDRNAMLSSYGARPGSEGNRHPSSSTESPYPGGHSQQGAGPFIPSDIHSQSTSQSSGDGSSTGLVEDSALSGLEGMVMDPMAGAGSAWDLQNVPPGSQPQDMTGRDVWVINEEGVAVLLPGPSKTYSQYRPRSNPNKQFECTVSGCGKTYYHRKHLKRHQLIAHKDGMGAAEER